MADVKISGMPPKGSAVATNDLFESSVGGTVTQSVTGQNIVDLAAAAVTTVNVTAAGAAMLTGADFTGDVSSINFIGPLNGAVQFTAKNRSGGTITKGQAIYLSGISGNTPTVGLADSDTGSMPAFGLAAEDASDNNNLEVTTFGSLHGVKTDYVGWALGDVLYVSTTPGTITNVPPAGEAAQLQNIGTIERLHSSNGTIKVGGAGRTNATPNLDNGNVFIGNGSNQSAARALVKTDITDLTSSLPLSGIKFGSGSPESSVTAPVGSIYMRSDGGANTSFYVKESGAGNTGWVGK